MFVVFKWGHVTYGTQLRHAITCQRWERYYKSPFWFEKVHLNQMMTILFE